MQEPADRGQITRLVSWPQSNGIGHLNSASLGFFNFNRSQDEAEGVGTANDKEGKA